MRLHEQLWLTVLLLLNHGVWRNRMRLMLHDDLLLGRVLHLLLCVRLDLVDHDHWVVQAAVLVSELGALAACTVDNLGERRVVETQVGTHAFRGIGVCTRRSVIRIGVRTLMHCWGTLLLKMSGGNGMLLLWKLMCLHLGCNLLRLKLLLLWRQLRHRRCGPLLNRRMRVLVRLLLVLVLRGMHRCVLLLHWRVLLWLRLRWCVLLPGRWCELMHLWCVLLRWYVMLLRINVVLRLGLLLLIVLQSWRLVLRLRWLWRRCAAEDRRSRQRKRRERTWLVACCRLWCCAQGRVLAGLLTKLDRYGLQHVMWRLLR